MKNCKRCERPTSANGSEVIEICRCDQDPQPALQPADAEDFYYENGLVVFTEKYHLKKGYCCGNNCRHCPY